MKITITNNNKLVPFEEVAEGTIFKDPATEDYYIKIFSEINENTGKEEWNCLHLDDYTLDYCSPIFMIYPIPDAELIIP